MTILLSPTDSQIREVLRSFVLWALPPGVACVLGQDNRVPEPRVDDFVVMTRIRSDRLATNIDSLEDAAYQAGIAGNVMAVSEVFLGRVIPGAALFGVGVVAGTSILSQLTGAAGGVGTYALSGASQNVSGEVMASGAARALQKTDVLYQLDVHGPNSSDNAELITTLFRDQYGVRRFREASDAIAIDPDLVVPLFADDPRQVPFANDQDQWEYRWIVEARMQANQSAINIPQQFASAVTVGIISVDERYPP